MGQKKGYKQTKEHILKRIRTGENHPNWKGDLITEKSGRSRAIRYFPVIGDCSLCGSPRSERHHIDGNTINNSPSNILIICRKCHMKEDGRLDKFKKLSYSNLPKARELARLSKQAITHCPKGHPYHGPNLYINKKGGRCCRQCLNEYKRKKRDDKSAARS